MVYSNEKKNDSEYLLDHYLFRELLEKYSVVIATVGKTKLCHEQNYMFYN